MSHRDDDASLLNQILRISWAASNYNAIIDPRQAVPHENDHFIEVQHFTAVLIEILKQRGEYDDWYSKPIGYFLDLSSFVNEHRNLFQISKAMNQAKKNVKLEDYNSNIAIQEYLRFKVLDKNQKQITVKQSVNAMLQEMAVRGTVGGNHPYGDLTREVGRRILLILGW